MPTLPNVAATIADKAAVENTIGFLGHRVEERTVGLVGVIINRVKTAQPT